MAHNDKKYYSPRERRQNNEQDYDFYGTSTNSLLPRGMPARGNAPISESNRYTPQSQFDAGLYSETQTTLPYTASLQPSPEFHINNSGTYPFDGWQTAGDHTATYLSNYALSQTPSSNLQISNNDVPLHHPYVVHSFQHHTPSWSSSSAYSQASGAGYNEQAVYGSDSQTSNETTYHERGASHHRQHFDSYSHTSGSQSVLQSATMSAASGSSPAGTSNSQSGDSAHDGLSWPSSSLTQSPQATSPDSSTRRNEGRPTEKPKAYSCSSGGCLSTFTSSNARKRHEKDRHSGKQLTCKYCGMTFADSTSVPRHQKLCRKGKGRSAGMESD